MSFDSFWLSYPRKLGKANAAKAYDKALKKGFSHASVIGGLAAYRQWITDNGTDTAFVLHASTFLNQERFNDDFGTDRNSQPAKGNTNNPRQSRTRSSVDTAVKIVQDAQAKMERDTLRLDRDLPY